MESEFTLAGYTRRDFVKVGAGSLAAASLFDSKLAFADGTERSYKFVEETDSDNGYDSVTYTLTWGAVRVSSVKDMVDKVLADFKEGDCIRSIVLTGHGAPGNISVGNGQTGTDTAKEINGNNENVWGPELDRLACKFCEGGTVYLRGCNVGAEQAGADKLFKIAKHLKCAVVQAPSGVCNPLWTTGQDQTVNPNDQNPPQPLDNPDKGKKKKQVEGLGEAPGIRAGADLLHSFAFDPARVAAARMLPRILGRPFSIDLLESEGIVLPPDVLVMFKSGLADAGPVWYPTHGFSLDAYLQVQLSPAPSNQSWITPGALIGGFQYYSSFRQDTTVAYVLPTPLVEALKALARH